MPINTLNPYLSFDGTAGQAIKLYESALGATVEHLQRFSDVPDMPVAPENKNRVIHAMLRLGGGVIMLSDSMPGTPAPSGNNNSVMLDFSDPVEMARRFEALAAGGQVTMPLQDTFWGAKFGTLTDAFGIPWMFNCTLKKD